MSFFADVMNYLAYEQIADDKDKILSDIDDQVEDEWLEDIDRILYGEEEE